MNLDLQPLVLLSLSLSPLFCCSSIWHDSHSNWLFSKSVPDCVRLKNKIGRIKSEILERSVKDISSYFQGNETGDPEPNTLNPIFELTKTRATVRQLHLFNTRYILL